MDSNSKSEKGRPAELQRKKTLRSEYLQSRMNESVVCKPCSSSIKTMEDKNQCHGLETQPS